MNHDPLLIRQGDVSEEQIQKLREAFNKHHFGYRWAQIDHPEMVVYKLSRKQRFGLWLMTIGARLARCSYQLTEIK